MLAGCAVPGKRTPPAAGLNGARHARRPLAIKHYPLPLDDISSGGSAIKRQLPIYPKSPLAPCPAPFDVQVRVDVNRNGRVEHDFGAVIDDVATTPRWHLYFLSAQAAAMQWRFIPCGSPMDGRCRWKQVCGG